MSRLPCVSCGASISPDASNCPYCGQRQLTRDTAVSYVTAALPLAVFGTAGLVWLTVPRVVASTVGLEGLLLGGVAVYVVSALGLWYAYRRRRALAGDPVREERAVD